MSDGSVDHYSVLGVEPDADRETIRGARQTKISEIDERLRNPKTKNKDELRRTKGDINRAWAVLADPYQRERYDNELGASLGVDVDGDGDDASGDGAAPGSGESGDKPREDMTLRERWKAGMESAPKGADEIPGGYEPAPVMRRLGAAGMDVIVMAAFLMVVTQVFASGLDEGEQLPGERVAGLILVAFVVLLAYNVVPVARNGQTLGHRLVKLKVVRADDGGPLGVSGSLRRYTIPVLLAATGEIFQMAAILIGLSFLFSQKGVSLLDRLGRSRVVVAPG